VAETRFYKLSAALAARRDLPPAPKILLSIFADRMGNNGYCWPGIRKLANDTGQDVSTVLRGITKLEETGCLKVERQGSGKSNRYYLVGDESAGKTQALAKHKRSQNANSGAGKMQAQARAKCKHNQRDQLNQTKRGRSQRKFTPPTAREVEEYARSIDFHVDGEKFVSHYAANGWMRGKTKMRDWRATVRYWKTTEKEHDGSGKIRDAEPVGEFIR
jgi:DNA-binding MarR family transcriptional regulator